MGSDGGRVDARAGRRGGARPRTDAGEAGVGGGTLGVAAGGQERRWECGGFLQVSEGGR